MKVLGAGGIAAAAGSAHLFLPRRAHAAEWGDYPDLAQGGLLPPELQAKNVLEVFLYGGLCPWETFYVVPEYGKADDTQFPNEQWWSLKVLYLIDRFPRLKLFFR